MKAPVKDKEIISDVSNDGAHFISVEAPYFVSIAIQGTAPILFHRWSCDGVAAKASAKKGSSAKKSDDLESYVWRTEKGELAIPGEYFRMSIIQAAKYLQDPRSPRKSAMDLFKAGIVSHQELCSLGVKDWDFLDRRRVTIQRNAITRQRPAMNAGWQAETTLEVLLAEYISPDLLHETIAKAGRLVGVGDFRPTFGRFQINRFSLLKL